MKKKLLWIILSIVLVVSLVFGLTACDKTQDLVPTNIKYDGQYITWDKVENAESYTVKINDGEEQSCATNTFKYNANGKTFSVVITGVLGKKSAASQVVEFKPLGAIEETSIVKNNDGSISWSPVENATAYKIKVNGKILDHYIYDTNFNELQGGTQNNIQIMPIVDGDLSYYSSWTKSISIKLLSKVDNINYNDEKGIITWNGFGGNYSIKITGDSGLVEDIINENSAMEYAYISNGNDFTVEIVALGDYVNTFDSKPASQEFIYLPTVSSISVIEGNLVWDAIAEADGYKIKIHQGNQCVTENLKEPKYSVKPGEEYIFEVLPYSLNTNIKYFSNWSQPKKVNVLNSPNLKWDSSSNPTQADSLNLYWDAVSVASGYKVEMVKDGKSSVSNYNESVLGHKCGYIDSGVYTVKVFAVGNQSDTFNSKPAEAEIVRLQAPVIKAVKSNPYKLVDFTVSYNLTKASKYVLYRDEVEITSSINGTLTDTTINIPTTEISKTYNYRVASIGKGAKLMNNKLYVELSNLPSKNTNDDRGNFQITVNGTIDSNNLKMDGYNLNWTSVSSANYGYSINGLSTTKETNNLTMDLSGNIVAAPRPTPVSVTTKGDGKSILPSKPSSEVKIQRIQTPTNTRFVRKSGDQFAFTCNKDQFVDNVSSYSLFLGNTEVKLSGNSTTDLYEHIDENGSVFYAVANANCYNNGVYYMTSEKSTSRNIFRLKTPEFPNKPFEDGNFLKWNKPENLQYWSNPTYSVYSKIDALYNGGEFLTKEEFNLSGLNAGEHVFRVRAIGDNGLQFIDSLLSNPITARKLDTPTVDIVNNKYTWLNDIGATYKILYDNNESSAIDIQGNNALATPYFTTAGQHQVKILVKGNGVNTFDGDSKEFNQEVKQLQIPKFTFTYNGEYYEQGNTITVKLNSPIDNSNGYAYNVFNTEVKKDQLEFTTPINQDGECLISVRALGGNFDLNKVYYIDSQNGKIEHLYLLDTPTNNSIKRTGTRATWGSVLYAVKYEYRIKNANEIVAEGVVDGTSLGNENIKTGATLEIRAIGDGTNNYVVSNWVSHTFT